MELETVSGNEYHKVDYVIDDGILYEIKEGIDDLRVSLGASDSPLLLRGLDDNTSIDGYYVRSGLGENVYIPVDRVQYLSKTSNGNLINLSSSTIYCYSLDSNGNRGRYYRFQSFGTLEYQYTSGYNTYWESTSALADNSNLTLGQVGLHSFMELALALILFMVTLIFFFRRK